jgi:hypothetical protein
LGVRLLAALGVGELDGGLLAVELAQHSLLEDGQARLLLGPMAYLSKSGRTRRIGTFNA